MQIRSATAEKDDSGRLKVFVEMNSDDSLILEQALLSFNKYDKDDPKYTEKLQHVKELVHKSWALTHPS